MKGMTALMEAKLSWKDRGLPDSRQAEVRQIQKEQQVTFPAVLLVSGHS